MQRILYVTRKTNEEILQQTGQKRELLKNVMSRQLQFFGHVMRKQKLEHVVICGKIRGKRARGRQRLKLMDQLKDVLGGSTEEILRAVNDLDQWFSTYLDYGPVKFQNNEKFHNFLRTGGHKKSTKNVINAKTRYAIQLHTSVNNPMRNLLLSF